MPSSVRLLMAPEAGGGCRQPSLPVTVQQPASGSARSRSQQTQVALLYPVQPAGWRMWFDPFGSFLSWVWEGELGSSLPSQTKPPASSNSSSSSSSGASQIPPGSAGLSVLMAHVPSVTGACGVPAKMKT